MAKLAPIASRLFEWTDESGVRSIRVDIGAPERVEQSNELRCPFVIVGLGTEELRYAFGVDGIQALTLALKMIRARLEAFQTDVPAKKLSWEGSEPGDLGL